MEKRRGSYNEDRDSDLLQSNGGTANWMQMKMEIDETNSADLSPISLCSVGGYIEHPISKFDTLAGIAIKYGVEVSDIKRMNALVTDHQMFALKSLHIPTPGRHPSPHAEDLDISRNSNCEQNSSRLMSYNLFDSFQSLRTKSSTLKAPLQADHHSNIPAFCEMTAYRKGELFDPMLASFPNPPLKIHHRKSRSFANGFPFENVEFTDIVTSPPPNVAAPDSIKAGEKLVRRRQKSMADFSAFTNSNGECLSTTTKGLDVRLKGAGARINNAANGVTTEVGKLTTILMEDEGDSILIANGISGGRRSSSTCNLQDTEKGNSSSSMWSAMATRSIFDGLPKGTTTRFKASMD